MKPLKFKGRMSIALGISIVLGLAGCDGGPDGGTVPADIKRILLPAFEKEFGGGSLLTNNTGASIGACDYAVGNDQPKSKSAYDDYYYYYPTSTASYNEIVKMIDRFSANQALYSMMLKTVPDDIGVILDFTDGENIKGEIIRFEDMGVLESSSNKKVHIIYLSNAANIGKLTELRAKIHQISTFNILK